MLTGWGISIYHKPCCRLDSRASDFPLLYSRVETTSIFAREISRAVSLPSSRDSQEIRFFCVCGYAAIIFPRGMKFYFHKEISFTNPLAGFAATTKPLVGKFYQLRSLCRLLADFFFFNYKYYCIFNVEFIIPTVNNSTGRCLILCRRSPSKLLNGS